MKMKIEIMKKKEQPFPLLNTVSYGQVFYGQMEGVCPLGEGLFVLLEDDQSCRGHLFEVCNGRLVHRREVSEGTVAVCHYKPVDSKLTIGEPK